MSEEQQTSSNNETAVSAEKKAFGLRTAPVATAPALRQPGTGPARTSNTRSGGDSRGGRSGSNGGFSGQKRPGGRDGRRQRDEDNSGLDSQVILVRRVTRVVKGGKRMRFSALVVVGDKAGRVGYGLKKGLDFQDAVAKATKKANDTLIKISLNSDGSVIFPTQQKFKSCEIMLKPAKTGTGLIAGGFLRPVLELAGVQNIYSKIIASRNKVAGVQATFEALKKYKVNK